MNRGQRSALRPAAMVLCATTVAAGAFAQEHIEVFQLTAQVMRGTETTTVYYVDAIDSFETALSGGLPPDAAQAGAVAVRRFEALTDADRGNIEAGARSLMAARQYRLTKVPAIVFDGAAVVYGLHDIDQARELYRAWRARGG